MPLVETVQSAAVSSTTDDASLVTEDASAAGQWTLWFYLIAFVD